MFNSYTKEKIIESVASLGVLIIQGSGAVIAILAVIFLFQGNLLEKAMSFILLLNSINGFFFYLFLFVLLPLAIFKKTKLYSGIAMFFLSYLFGLALWIYSAIITYLFWGWFGLIVGIVLVGVGVFPVAVLASIFNGEWIILVNLIFGVAATFGIRFLGLYLINKTDTDQQTATASSPDLSLAKNDIDNVNILDAEIEDPINDDLVEVSVKFCGKCGKENSLYANFCRYCGNKLN